ncbi:hypothetical protein ACFUN8_02790 [Streptomyces sp. NPDC057307]|uniref:hypothetical protein n=1 Tax=Streptomyces sp. NPDC057307 TaxID=3346096 RepID=UPI003629BAF9
MRRLNRTGRAETVLGRRTKAEIGRALERSEGFQKQGLPAMAQGALDARITVVVKMSVADFLEYAANEAHGRYTAHLEVCGCRAVGVFCGRGDELAKEWREARELAGAGA